MRAPIVPLLLSMMLGPGCSEKSRANESGPSADRVLPPATPPDRDDAERLVRSALPDAPDPAASETLALLRQMSRSGMMSHRVFAALFQTVSRSVVNVFTTRHVRRVAQEDLGDDSLSRYEQFFGSEARENLQRSLGSGFVIDRRGYVLTNDHVIEDADEIRVRLWNRRELEATVVGRDPKTDLAVIRVRPTRELVPVVFGSSEKLAIGDWVAAIGNPFGLSHTMTVGVVSAKGRKSRAGEAVYNLIQTDATINPGNSGGPLLNLQGEVVGVNTSISALGKGIGFAIPIDVAKEVIPQLKLKGRVIRPWLGIYHQPLTPELAESFGLRRPRGALVAGVLEGGPAWRAGLRQGDIILAFDGQPLPDSDALRLAVYRAPLGKTARLTVWRERRQIALSLPLEPDPEELKAPPEKPPPAPRILGMSLGEAGADEGSEGVVVRGVIEGSVAWDAGIRADDLVLSINGVAVTGIDAYQAEYQKLAPGDICQLKIRRRGVEQFVAFRVPE